MKIKLSPERNDNILKIEKTGDILTINGETFDFSILQEGDLLPNNAITSYFIKSDVERIDGEINLTILMPHGANATAAQRFPETITIIEDGEVQLP